MNNDNVIDISRFDTVKDLANMIISIKSKPEDQYEISAILEANGWSDKRVMETYGVASVFVLANMIWKIIQKNKVFTTFTAMSKQNFGKHKTPFFKYFLKGMIFALPMAISVFAMLTIKFSLWSYVSFDIEVATSIAIGTILSFLSIGGFTQAIAKQGYGYIRQGYFDMAKKSTYYFIRMGYILSTLVVIFLLAGNAFLDIFPYKLMLIIIFYYFFLNAIWLAVTIMYIFEKELLFSGLLVLGIAIIYLLFRIFQINIMVSQIIALFFVAILGIITSLIIFAKKEKDSKQDVKPSLPRRTIILNSVMSYFIYGLIYFAFLFTDRIIAWSTNDLYMPLIIWFRGEYELGLDFALLILIIPMGFVEYIVNEMMNSISGMQKEYYSYEVDRIYKKYKSMYFNRVMLIAVVSMISGILVYFLLQLIMNNYFKFISIGISQTTHFVFIVALFGYVFTAMGLQNVEILFSLTQPKLVNRCIIPAFLTNIFVGFILSRWFVYTYAVFGLLAGSIVFFGVSTYMVIKVIRKIDYYLYAAA